MAVQCANFIIPTRTYWLAKEIIGSDVPLTIPAGVLHDRVHGFYLGRVFAEVQNRPRILIETTTYEDGDAE